MSPTMHNVAGGRDGLGKQRSSPVCEGDAPLERLEATRGEGGEPSSTSPERRGQRAADEEEVCPECHMTGCDGACECHVCGSPVGTGSDGMCPECIEDEYGADE